MRKWLNSNQMCKQFSYKEVSYREVLLYILNNRTNNIFIEKLFECIHYLILYHDI